MSWRALLSAGLVSFLFGSACGSIDADDSPTPTGDQKAHGTFQLSLVAPRGATPGFTAILGRAYDGPFPATVIWEDQTGDGACRLYIPRIPFCDPPCEAGVEACVEDDVCQPYPSPMTVGKVEVTGLTKPFAMTPINATYQIVGVDLPYPAFSEGDDLRLKASGDATAAAFTMRAKGIAPLVVLDGELLVDDSPAKISWEAPKNTASSEISVVFDVSYHGGTKGKVECLSPDIGSLVVPGDLLTALIDLGTSGFPKVEITRISNGTTEPPYAVALLVQAKVTRFLSIPGVVSCMSTSDCPEGETCGHDFKCI